jgi:hypothetical protein
MDRRPIVTGLWLISLVLTSLSCGAAPVSKAPPGNTATIARESSTALAPNQTAFLDSLEERTFRWFWDTTPANNGLTPDRWPTHTFSSVAAVGFALTAYPIGIERGWVTREQGIERTLTTLRFLWNARQDTSARGATGHRGFFYHFLYMENGERFKDVELSTIDTGLLFAGALFCQSYFDRKTAGEDSIRALAERLYARADWRWFQPQPPSISLGWSPEEGFLPYNWRGYNETMIMMILALGSPTHPVDPSAWSIWTSGYKWGTFQGQQHLGFAPLFGHQYSHVWIDFRGIRDSTMRAHDLDYYENSRRATLAQRALCDREPERLDGLRRTALGSHGVRRPARRQAHRWRAHARVPQLHGARRHVQRHPRRRNDRADRRGQLDRVHAVRGAADAPGDACGLRRGALRTLWFHRCVQPHAARAHAGPGRQDRPGSRLVRHGLPRYRPGPDPRDDREPP